MLVQIAVCVTDRRFIGDCLRILRWGECWPTSKIRFHEGLCSHSAESIRNHLRLNRSTRTCIHDHPVAQRLEQSSSRSIIQPAHPGEVELPRLLRPCLDTKGSRPLCIVVDIHNRTGDYPGSL